MKIFKNILLKFIIPVIVLIVLFKNKTIYGLLFLLLYFIYIAYNSRAGIYSFIGNVNYSKGKINDAIEWFKRASLVKGSNTKFTIGYGYLLLKNSKVDEAYEVFSNLSKTKLNGEMKMSVKSNLALAIWKKGDLDGAIELLWETYNDYKNSTVYGSLGYLLILKGDLDKALQFNLEAYDFNNTDPVILDNLAQTYYFIGDYDKALEIHEKLHRLSPNFAEAYYDFGLVLMAKNEYERALECIRKAATFRLYALSAVTKEEIDAKITEIMGIIDTKTEK